MWLRFSGVNFEQLSLNTVYHLIGRTVSKSDK